VNAYEVKAGMVFIAGKLCDPCLSALKWFVYHARRYTSALLLPLPCDLGFSSSYTPVFPSRMSSSVLRSCRHSGRPVQSSVGTMHGRAVMERAERMPIAITRHPPKYQSPIHWRTRGKRHCL